MLDATILTYDPADFAALLLPTATPRDKWLAKHNLVVRDYQDRRNGGVEYHSLNTARWLVANRAMTRYASADTQEEAEYEYSCRHGIEWWKLAGWQEAMG